MDSLFVEGLAATISALIVFCGSVWLLLALVLGPRLSYFITASITLGFLLMMGGVWSYGEPLGPVGELPSYKPVGAADSPDEIQFGPAADYPDGGGWTEAGEDEVLVEIKTGAEGAASGDLEDAIEEQEVTAFARADQATVDAEGTRVLERDGIFYAIVRFKPVPVVDEDIAPEEGDDADGGDEAAEEEPAVDDDAPDENAEAFVVLEQDPGNPSGEARMITVGFLVLLVLHLVGLSRSEKQARRSADAT